MKISPSSAFRILRRNRALAAIGSEAFVVRSVKQDGTVSRTTPSMHDYFRTEGEAEARRVYLEQVNPGRRFIVCRNP